MYFWRRGWDRVIFRQSSNFYGGKVLPLFAPDLRRQSEEKEKLDQTQGVSHVRDDFAGALQVRALVRGCHHGTQPRLAFGNGGKSDRRDVDAGIVQAAREFKGLRSFAHMNGSDGRLRRAGGKAGFFQTALEEFRICPELLEQLVTVQRIEQRERSLARGDH